MRIGFGQKSASQGPTAADNVEEHLKERTRVIGWA
jgi:hypothetical protein